MAEDVRVIEYSFGDPEQRRSLAEAMSEELERGASVLAAIPVSLRRDGDDLSVTRVAVYFLGGDDLPPPTHAEAVAMATAEDSPSESIVEEILSIPTASDSTPSV